MSDKITVPQWIALPRESYPCDGLSADGGITVIAIVEDFDYAIYPAALNAVTGNWERGGPHRDMVAARLWAERVAGLHPLKPGDERPAFYYETEE